MMNEGKATQVKKIGEGNKSLSVIVAEEKLAKFKRFSQNINLSMGYLLNQAIDRYLVTNSTEIFSTSTGVPTSIGTNITSAAVQDEDMEKLINTSIETYLLNNSIGSLAKTDLEELVNTSIDNRISNTSIGIEEVKKLIKTSIDNIEVDKLVKAETEHITNLLTELETKVETMREELLALRVASPTDNHSATTKSVAIPVKTTDKDSGVKSWAEFFKMIGMDALTSAEAQKKEKIDIRTEQVKQGLQAVREKGLGEWAVKVAGRSFVRVGD